MVDSSPTARRRVEVANPLGVNMRTATRLVTTAASFRSQVTLEYGASRASGHSVLDVCTLAAECGATITIEARGTDAEEAVAALAELLATVPSVV